MDRKNEFRGKALEYFLEHGLADLSLRPLAAKAGTSARLLLYHFGSQDGLIAAVMEEARLRVQQSFSESMRESGRQGPLQRQLAPMTGRPWLAILIQAILFAIGHAYEGPVAVADIVVIGLILGSLAAWRGNIRAAILVHAALDILGGFGYG